MSSMLRRCLITVASFALLAISLGSAYADDAAVLAKGRWRVAVDTAFYLDVVKRYNRNGDAEDAAKDFNVNMSSSVFTGLRAFETGGPCALPAPLCLPAGAATLGRSVVSFNESFKLLTGQIAYGVTDKLSVGMNIPYWYQRVQVKADVNTATATICKGAVIPGGL